MSDEFNLSSLNLNDDKKFPCLVKLHNSAEGNPQKNADSICHNNSHAIQNGIRSHVLEGFMEKGLSPEMRRAEFQSRKSHESEEQGRFNSHETQLPCLVDIHNGIKGSPQNNAVDLCNDDICLNDSDGMEYGITQALEEFMEERGLSTDICRAEFQARKLHELEEQQERLNSNLIALSTHFAQVQLRLKQIVDAPPPEKEYLLKSLEEFAFSGIPDVSPDISANLLNCNDVEDPEEKLKLQREKQKELIATLKSQLEDLEKYAYKTGDAGMPQSEILERQSLILDQLKGLLNLNIDHIDELTIDDLKMHVDRAISQLMNPMKMKEHLVTQLKTQISDLERFIEFLQGGSVNGVKKRNTCTCNCPLHDRPHTNRRKASASYSDTNQQNVEMHTKTLNIMRRAATLLQLFARHQFGNECADRFSKNSLKKDMKYNHYGDLRAQLEMAVVEVMELMTAPSITELPADSDYVSDSEGVSSVQCDSNLATAVRKKLAISIQNLMQHGLMPIGQSNSLVPFIGCFPPRQASSKNFMHAWELVLKFYELKDGDQFNSTPARKLSQSFNLDIVGGSAMSYKQSLLGVIGNIIATHTPYKRSYDSHFKAFVCAGLNSKMLVIWLRLIFRCQPLIDLYYQPWSYVVLTGFEDSFVALEQLNQYNFDLPVDLAIRQLQNIKDAF